MKRLVSAQRSRLKRKRYQLAVLICSLFPVAQNASLATDSFVANRFSPTASTKQKLNGVHLPQQRELVQVSLMEAQQAADSDGDSFLNDASPTSPPASQAVPPTTAPTIEDDSAALLEQSLAPQSSLFPDLNTLDAPSFNLSSGLSASLGATRDSRSVAPAMMGDFFGGTFIQDSTVGATIALAGGDRMFKIAENVSPACRDRIFFNYNHFHNALEDVNEENYSLDRFTFGGEKSFYDQQISVEARLPFASALNSTYDFANPDPIATELGNLAFALKGVLWRTDKWLLSAGSTMSLPTGDDYIQKSGGVTQLLIKNDAVHLAPFVGLLAQPSKNWFVQSFIQTDFDTRGDRVFSPGFNNSLSLDGRIQNQNLLFVDVSIGRWLITRRLSGGKSLGIAAVTELHYTSTMNDTDSVLGLTNPNQNMDILNATKGLHIQYNKYAIRIGATAPLREGAEKLFDAEGFVQASRAL